MTIESKNFPLSAQQERIWSMCKLYPSSTHIWNAISARTLQGNVQADVLYNAIARVIDLHSSLRTVIIEDGNEARQCIYEKIDIDHVLQVVNLRHLEEDEKQKIVLEHIVKEEGRSFDLHVQLWNITLFQLEATSFCIILNLHHIMHDARAISIFWEDLAHIYNGLLTNPEPIPRHQYFEYTVVQKNAVAEDLLHERYWLNEFKEDVPAMSIPYDFNGGEQTFEGESFAITLSSECAAGFRKFCFRNRLTPSSAILGLYYHLLSELTGQKDIVLGTYMNGRTLPASQQELQNVFNVLGMFSTTIALRLHPAQSLSVLELLKYVHRKFSDAFVHQSYPYQKLVQKLRNEGKSFGLDLFHLGYNYISYPVNPVFHQCTFDHFDFPSKLFLENDITLRVLEREQSLTISLDYKPAVFSRVTIESFARNIEHLVETIEMSANASFNTLEGNSGAEIDRLIELGSGSKAKYPATPLIKRFEEQVKLQDSKPAVFYNDRNVSYFQLNAKANALAQLLMKRGVGKGSYVPVITDQPEELVVSLIALLKIGAIYVPLDVTWPQDRLKGIIDEIDPRCIIVTESNFSDPGKQLCLEVNFDSLPELLTDYHNEVQSDSPVYMIYTSGSTGKPKGVVITHAGLSNRIFWMDDYFGKATCQVVLQTTRYVYDSSIWQFLWPLVNGGCVVLPNEQISFDTDNIVSLIDKYRVTIIDFVPSLFDKFVHDLSQTAAYHIKLQSLCHIILGGEAIVVPTTLRFRNLFPSVELTNLYGPTEATIGCVHYKIQGDEKKIPIGRPISNMKVYIMKGEGKLCIRGAVGELVVGGPGVAKGYFNDESKTAQVFIKSDHSANEILYRTGDLARWLPDGQLEFLGRKDEQIALRGLRIEPGEIEVQIRQFPGITSALVTDVNTEHGKALCAYVVASEKISSTGLKKFLRSRLPGYMIPSFIESVSELPLSASGKVDKKRLPHPSPDTGFRSHTGLDDVLSKEIGNLWAEVLQIDKLLVNRQTSFFDLGGHSLKAIEMLSRIHSQYHVKVSIRDFFNDATVDGLCQIILTSPASNVPRIQPVHNTNSEYRVSYAQQRMFILHSLTHDNISYNISMALKLHGEVTSAKIESAFRQLMVRHSVLRTTFSVKGRNIVQRVHNVGVLDFFEMDFSTNAFKSFIKPFHLSKLPLFRVAVATNDKDEMVMLFDIHHIICDGISINILMRDFIKCLAGFDINSSEQTVDYKDYAEWEGMPYFTEKILGQQHWWKMNLKGYVDLNLPTDFERPLVQNFDAGRLQIVIDQELCDKLNQFVRTSRVTTFTYLLSVFKLLIYKISGDKDIVVGSPTSGRYHPDISRVVGMFANSLVIRTIIDEHMTFPELLAGVHHNLLAALDHEEYPFEELVKALNVRRDTSRNPLFNVIFAFQNDYESEFRHNDIIVEKVNILEQESGTAKVDLAFWCKATSSSIIIDVEYSTSLFKRETVEEWCYLYNELVTLCIHESATLENILLWNQVNLNQDDTDHLNGRNIIL